MTLTVEELDALIDCVNTREDEGFDVTIARSALNKLAGEIVSNESQKGTRCQTQVTS